MTRETPREQRMRQILLDNLSPSLLRIDNQSHLHVGHTSAPDEMDTNYMQSHFLVEICSESFRGLSRIAAQQLVYQLLDDEFKSGLHALSLELYS